MYCWQDENESGGFTQKVNPLFVYKLFFQLIAKRYERNSTIITTNIDLPHWGEVFGDPVLADAILDRLLHHCKVVHIVGDSYRLRNAMQELKAE